MIYTLHILKSKTHLIKSYFERIISLLIVTLFLASTVVYSKRLLGYELNNLGSKNISSSKKLILSPSAEETMALGLGVLTETKRGVWTASDGTVVLNTIAFTHDVYGHGGLLPIFIAIDKQGVIMQIIISKNSESTEFLETIIQKQIPERWIGKDLNQVLETPVDAVSGATTTSMAIIKSVKQTLGSYVGEIQQQSAAPLIGWTKAIAVLGVVAFGIFISFFKSGNKTLRLIQLGLNIVVLGFWCGQFISLSLLTSWLGNGTSFIQFWPMIVILITAVGLPLFLGKKGHYCNWICPYGAAQELVGKCSKHKFKNIPKWLKHSREVLLMLIFFILWLGVGIELIRYEPFSAFMFMVASPLVIVIAAAFLFLSLFVNRPFCRFVCPTGQLLTWSQKIK